MIQYQVYYYFKRSTFCTWNVACNQRFLISLTHWLIYIFACRIFTMFLSTDLIDGRLGPSTVVLDHTSGFEGLLFVDDDLLGVRIIHIPLMTSQDCKCTKFIVIGEWCTRKVTFYRYHFNNLSFMNSRSLAIAISVQ